MSVDIQALINAGWSIEAVRYPELGEGEVSGDSIDVTEQVREMAAHVREQDARICDEVYERLGSRTARDLARAIRADNKNKR